MQQTEGLDLRFIAILYIIIMAIIIIVIFVLIIIFFIKIFSFAIIIIITLKLSVMQQTEGLEMGGGCKLPVYCTKGGATQECKVHCVVHAV